jgi:hypothetical protein
MQNKEKELILKLALNELTTNDFMHQYPVNLGDHKDYVLKVLESSLISKDSDDVTYALLLGFSIDAFSQGYSRILCKLLLEGWHYKHEDIILILQKLKDPASVNCLYQSALMHLDYLDYDETHALARKAIHALADINTDEARQKLALLAESNVPVIREKAEKQLRKL